MAKGGDDIIWLLVLGGLGYVAYEKLIKPGILVPAATAQYAQNLQVTLQNVRLALNKVTLSIQIANPNPTPMKLAAVVGQFWIISTDGKSSFHIGNISQYPNEVIQPDANTDVNVSIDLKLGPVLALVASIAQGAVKGVVLQFQGNVNANGRVWPVQETFNLS